MVICRLLQFVFVRPFARTGRTGDSSQGQLGPQPGHPGHVLLSPFQPGVAAAQQACPRGSRSVPIATNEQVVGCDPWVGIGTRGPIQPTGGQVEKGSLRGAGASRWCLRWSCGTHRLRGDEVAAVGAGAAAATAVRPTRGSSQRRGWCVRSSPSWAGQS